MATTFPIDTLMERVRAKYGVPAIQVREQLGDNLFETILNSELTLLCCTQDESIDPANIVRILRQGRDQIIDYINRS